jgi:hypothetical protein
MIEPKYVTLQQLFTDRVFRIPHYQRFYSWRTKQREDLFGDLLKLVTGSSDDHHFMATIVCYRTPEVKESGTTEYRVYDIVDGQQRLTTLIIILKCIQLRLKKDGREYKELADLLVKQDDNMLLLQTNNPNQHIFNTFLLDGHKPRKDEVRNHADRNLMDAIRDCDTFIEEKWRQQKGDEISLLRAIKNRLGFVVFDTEDSKIVYKLFEVLNSRGLAVDWLDKCKSVLMGRAFELSTSPDAARSAIDSIHALWGNIYDEIATVPVKGEQILRVFATLRFGPSKGKPQPSDVALEGIRKECTTKEKPRQISDGLLDITRKLVTLEKNIFLGPVTEILHVRILAVALESADHFSEKERNRLLDQWERVTFRIFGLFGKDSRHKVGEYIRLASNVNNREKGSSRYSEVMEALRDLGKEHTIDEAVKEGLENKDCYWDNPDRCRYILWKYEESLAYQSGSNATVDENVRREIWSMRATDSIEHIFPQNRESGGAWSGKMRRGNAGPEADVDSNINRIGNLILLPFILNAEARRRGFDEKKKIYARHNLRQIDDVTRLKDWNLAQIEDRERRIMSWARTAWSDLGSD